MNTGSRKYIFIVNPSSGNQKLRNWETLLATQLSSNNYEILYTRYAGHSSSILANHKNDVETCIVAVGGDGTISELVATILKNGNQLGIIPTGSGNGLARHLKIPLNPAKAIQKLNSGKAKAIDLIQINEQYCCNTCGIGFSALVAKHFGTTGQRGFKTYFKLALSLYKTSKSFDVELNGVHIPDVWLLEFANSSQLGNNAIVSPYASVDDGIIDILILKRPKPWNVPAFIFLVLSGNILKSGLSKLIKATEINLQINSPQDYHIDGEYKGRLQNASLNIIPSVLKIIQ